jgi:uridine kinase
MRLGPNDILCMEGIHALNPELTSAVDQSKIFRIYISALSALPGGEKIHNSTTDKRLLRRIVRDNRVRGISPEGTILRWPSVRAGEEKNIFPFEENAEVVFNSSTLYDIPLLRYYAEPLLEGIAESSPAYEKARKLLTFLGNITALKPIEIAAVPPTSIMREFIGGQTL